MTSFTLYIYTDCLDHRDYNLHVQVFGNDILELKYPLTELLISDTIFSSPEQSSRRAIVLPPALALASASTNVKVLR